MSSPHMDFTDVLAECIEAIEQGETTMEACLARYPEYAARLQELFPVMVTFRSAPAVTPTPTFRQHTRQHMLSQLRPLPNENVTFLDSLRHRWQRIGTFQMTRRLNMTWILLIATAISLVAGGGVVYASDTAVPGDTLYTLDLSLEELRLNLAANSETKTALQLAFAEERLQEAEELINEGDTDLYQEALDGYGVTISAIAQTIGSTEGAEQEAVGRLLEEALSKHDARLGGLFAGEDVAAAEDDEAEGNDEDDVDPERCTGIIEHPTAQRIAEQYDRPVAEIMDWFCNGAGFGEIMLAYSISEQTGTPVSDLFTLREEGYGWGQIMLGADLIGPPDGAGPPDTVPQGPPDNAGPPDGAGAPDDVPQGPPDNAGPPDGAGAPDNAPQGPPDHAGPPDGAGAPDNTPQGPPDHAGPPDNVPSGPPNSAGPPAGTPGGGRP